MAGDTERCIEIAAGRWRSKCQTAAKKLKGISDEERGGITRLFPRGGVEKPRERTFIYTPIKQNRQDQLLLASAYSRVLVDFRVRILQGNVGARAEFVQWKEDIGGELLAALRPILEFKKVIEDVENLMK